MSDYRAHALWCRVLAALIFAVSLPFYLPVFLVYAFVGRQRYPKPVSGPEWIAGMEKARALQAIEER